MLLELASANKEKNYRCLWWLNAGRGPPWGYLWYPWDAQGNPWGGRDGDLMVTHAVSNWNPVREGVARVARVCQFWLELRVFAASVTQVPALSWHCCWHEPEAERPAFATRLRYGARPLDAPDSCGPAAHESCSDTTVV